jgi:hypothetical protein
LEDVASAAGPIDHCWLNRRAMAMMPALAIGCRIRFWADLRRFQKKDGSSSVRLECIREVEELG